MDGILSVFLVKVAGKPSSLYLPRPRHGWGAYLGWREAKGMSRPMHQ